MRRGTAAAPSRKVDLQPSRLRRCGPPCRSLGGGGKVRLYALACAIVICTMVIAAATVGAQAQATPPRNQGPLFPPQDLGLLEFPDRAAWQKPEQIMDALRIADGSVVADIGPGAGWFTMHLARRVGPTGLVYARDVQPEMVEAVRRRVNRAGLNNVRPALADVDDPRLPPGALDAVSLVDVYQEISDPVTYLRNVTRSLKPNGRIGIVNYKPVPRGGPGPAVRIERATVEADASAAGLRIIAHENLPYQYLLVLGR